MVGMSRGEHFFDRFGQMNVFGKAGFLFGRDRVGIERDIPQFIDLAHDAMRRHAGMGIDKRTGAIDTVRQQRFEPSVVVQGHRVGERAVAIKQERGGTRRDGEHGRWGW